MTDQMCLVLAGGDAILPVDPVPHPGFVIAADGGLALAERLGVTVDLVVGDLDSTDPDALERARAAGASVEQHPEDKDKSDLELALDAAASREFQRVIVIGGTALDRIDHLLLNAGLIGAARFAGLAIEWRIGATRVLPVHGSVLVEGEPGDTLSIVPLGGSAIVTARGVRWPLDEVLLQPDSTRSVSNRFTGRAAEITVSAGLALVVHTRGTR